MSSTWADQVEDQEIIPGGRVHRGDTPEKSKVERRPVPGPSGLRGASQPDRASGDARAPAGAKYKAGPPSGRYAPKPVDIPPPSERPRDLTRGYGPGTRSDRAGGGGGGRGPPPRPSRRGSDDGYRRSAPPSYEPARPPERSAWRKPSVPTETGILSSVKGTFGFIMCCDRNTRLFFPFSSVIGYDVDKLREGDEVEFCVIPDPRGQGEVASDIRVLPQGTVSFDIVLDDIFEAVVKKPIPRNASRHRGYRAKDERTEAVGVLQVEIQGEMQEIKFTIDDQVDKKLEFRAGDIVTFNAAVSKRTNEKKAAKVTLKERVKEDRYTGVVRSLKSDFGFMKCAEKEMDVWFHFSEVDSKAPIRNGMEFEFALEKDKKTNRLRAVRMDQLPHGTVQFEVLLADTYTGYVELLAEHTSSFSDRRGGGHHVDKVSRYGQLRYSSDDNPKIAIPADSKDENGNVFIKYLASDIGDPRTTLGVGDKITFKISVEKASGRRSAKELVLLQKAPEERFEGIVCDLKRDFGFIRRAEVDEELYFRFTDVQADSDEDDDDDDNDNDNDNDNNDNGDNGKGSGKGKGGKGGRKKEPRPVRIGDEVDFAIETVRSRRNAVRVKVLPKGTVQFDTFADKSEKGVVEVAAVRKHGKGKEPLAERPGKISVLVAQGSKKSKGGAAGDGNGKRTRFPFWQEDVESCEENGKTSILGVGDTVEFTVATEKRSGQKRAAKIHLLSRPTDQGIVTDLRPNFGFIQATKQVKEVFFHISQYPSDKQPRIRDEVEFVVSESGRDDKVSATHIKLLPKGTVSFYTLEDKVYEGTIQTVTPGRRGQIASVLLPAPEALASATVADESASKDSKEGKDGKNGKKKERKGKKDKKGAANATPASATESIISVHSGDVQDPHLGLRVGDTVSFKIAVMKCDGSRRCKEVKAIKRVPAPTHLGVVTDVGKVCQLLAEDGTRATFFANPQDDHHPDEAPKEADTTTTTTDDNDGDQAAGTGEGEGATEAAPAQAVESDNPAPFAVGDIVTYSTVTPLASTRCRAVDVAKSSLPEDSTAFKIEHDAHGVMLTVPRRPKPFHGHKGPPPLAMANGKIRVLTLSTAATEDVVEEASAGPDTEGDATTPADVTASTEVTADGEAAATEGQGETAGEEAIDTPKPTTAPVATLKKKRRVSRNKEQIIHISRKAFVSDTCPVLEGDEILFTRVTVTRTGQQHALNITLPRQIGVVETIKGSIGLIRHTTQPPLDAAAITKSANPRFSQHDRRNIVFTRRTDGGTQLKPGDEVSFVLTVNESGKQLMATDIEFIREGVELERLQSQKFDEQHKGSQLQFYQPSSQPRAPPASGVGFSAGRGRRDWVDPQATSVSSSDGDSGQVPGGMSTVTASVDPTDSNTTADAADTPVVTPVVTSETVTKAEAVVDAQPAAVNAAGEEQADAVAE